MIALEAKYHSSCLTQLYNRRRAHEREHFREFSSSNSESAHGIVFAQLTAYISDVRTVGDIVPVFKLVHLKNLYLERLRQLDPATVHTVNSSRLKDKLLGYFPDMRAQNDGRDVLLAFEDNLGAALSKACSSDVDEDALHLAKAAEIVRREMFVNTWQFDMSMGKGCQEQSVPSALLSLVQMILEGPSIDVQSLEQQTSPALTIAQLMVFNGVHHKRTSVNRVSPAKRHAKEQETPLPLYVGLAVHAATRKKRLVDKLFNLGICVSYERVMSVLNDVASGLCDRFEIDKAVCPLNLKCETFTTAAVDNIDHNPSATTAHSSFHGTGISLQQYPDPTVSCTAPTVQPTVLCPQAPGQVFSLPESYTFVPPVRLVKQEPDVPLFQSDVGIDTTVDVMASNVESVALDESKWLHSVWANWQSGTFAADSVCSWSAYHAQSHATSQQGISVCGMLPLFHENAHSVAMIRHAMDVVHTSVAKLNPCQVPVIAFDQPLYTLAKLIQWNWPEYYGESKFVIMFGGLHVEIAALKALGSLVTGSGWAKAITDAGIVSSGSAEGLLTASHVRRCRRAHEISLAALHILQQLAYEKSGGDNSSVSFADWCSQQCLDHPQFAFWSAVMQLQTAILVFVHSLRESDFDLYVNSLSQLLPWLFALDRTNYARWLSVHVRDMRELSKLHPVVLAEFRSGKFTVNKTGNKFSAIAIDQAHEQLNAVVKGDGGIVGLTDNDKALRRLLLSGPEVARLLAEFESNSSLSKVTGVHHEQTLATQQAFVSDVNKLVDTMQQFGNPFEDQHDLVVLHSRKIISPTVAQLASKLYATGKQQYHSFVTNRLCTNSETLFAPLKRNKFQLFATPKLAVASKLKSKITASRNDSELFSRLYIACQVRDSDLDQFFSHENQVYPPALSDAGSLHFGCKSDLLSCLESVHPSVETVADVDGIILDGSVVVNMLKPGNAKTFNDYVNDIFMPYIHSQLCKARRVDVVWDRYDKTSLKGLAREKRGTAVRQQVNASAPVPRNWGDFLRNEENKTSLFAFLAEQMCSKPLADGKQLVSSYDTGVITTVCEYDLALLQPCGHEEADTRILLHAADMVNDGLTRILIRTVDTDVVVLSVAFCHKLCCEQLWLAFGTGQRFRYISAHDLASALGRQQACALPVFHAFTGCETVSAFVGRGKKTCWEMWKKFPEVTQTFSELFNMPSAICDSSLAVLQRFVILLYDVNCRCVSVNAARKKLFASKGKSVENIPPTLDALVQHTRRAVYQAGYIWSQSLVLQPILPSPSDWGWSMVDNCWHPLWMTIPDAAKCCPELKRCTCKTGCLTKRCKCVKDEIPCTALCACDGDCRQ